MGKRRGEKPGLPGWAPLILLCALISGCHYGPLVLWEQRHLDVRDPAQLPHAVIPDVPLPATVSSLPSSADPTPLSLDEAIRIALANSKVVRALAGDGAFTSGQTIYDPAIANTAIDEARAAFDPVITARNAFNRLEQPQAFLDPRNPTGTSIFGTRIDNHELGLGISKRTILGGTLDLDATSSTDRFTPGPAPLNPQERSSLSLRYTQPLLKGAGIGPNLAPIIIARINTERSYFQFKDSVQELVRGVIEAYWAVVFSRTDVWARRQQEEQGEFAYARAEARRQVGKVTAGEVAQAKVSLSNFKAARIGAEASLLQREAALRNIMGLPPSEPEQLVPTTPPSPVRLEPKWDAILRLAEEQRPDLIELKLIIEADEQALIVARNQALPQLDANMLYRWNGLEGTAPNGTRLSTKPGEFTDWTLGVNFSVPIGLRRSRAGLRRSELFLARDWANLNQEMHNTLHLLAGNLRNLAQFHDLYRTYKETRAAARLNLEQQFFDYKVGRGEEVKNSYLNVLLAITDWGNAVSSEAQALAQYNTELANLERQTGTILETHGIRFAEEMFGSIGPLGRLAKRQGYPSALVPGPNAPRYPAGAEPADKLLEKEKPSLRGPVPPPPPPEEPPPPKRVPRLDVRPLPDAG